MRWFITTGGGLAPHSAHDSLDAALQCVHLRLLRGKGFDSVRFEASTGDDNGEGDGTITLLDWHAPSRAMTNDEIDEKVRSGEITKKIGTHWKKVKVNVTDWERANRIVEFVTEPVDSVAICREDRHRQYLQRASICNGKTKDIADFESLINPPNQHQPTSRKVLVER